MLQSLEELIKIIRERKKSSPDKSYTNKLLNDKKLSLDKVKEEISELIESVEQNTNKIHEAADVIYHLLVYFESNGIKIEDVIENFEPRARLISVRALPNLDRNEYECTIEFFVVNAPTELVDLTVFLERLR